MAQSKSKKSAAVPEARAALNKFKMEAAKEVGVSLQKGYNGHLTSQEAGSVGGQMVKKMTTERTLRFTRPDRTAAGHVQQVSYRCRVVT